TARSALPTDAPVVVLDRLRGRSLRLLLRLAGRGAVQDRFDPRLDGIAESDVVAADREPAAGWGPRAGHLVEGHLEARPLRPQLLHLRKRRRFDAGRDVAGADVPSRLCLRR